MSSSPRSPWPLAIIAWFATFIAFLAAFIVFAVGQRDDLVRRDYYEEEVRYQHQLDRANRGQDVGREVTIQYQAAIHRVTIQVPASQARFHPTGRINFYRPADASLDHAIPFVPDANGAQHVDASHLRSGLWKVHLYWSVNDQEFYFEQSIVIGASAPAASSTRAKESSSSSPFSKFTLSEGAAALLTRILKPLANS